MAETGNDRSTEKLMSQTDRLEDVESALSGLSEAEHLKNAHTEHMLPGEGAADIGLNFCDGLFYEILSETVDLPIENDYSLVETIKLLSQVKKEYDKISGALGDVRRKGYGVVTPAFEEITLENQKYSNRAIVMASNFVPKESPST